MSVMPLPVKCLPGEILLQVFQYLETKNDLIMCALVCTSWCHLIREEFITEEGAKSIIHPFSCSVPVRCVRLNREWLSECLTFMLGRHQLYTIEELEIVGLTYAHLEQLRHVLSTTINSVHLRRIAFLDAFVALEKYAPIVFNMFPNLSNFTVAFPGGSYFRRRTEANALSLKSSKFQHLTHLQLRLCDRGFKETSNHLLANMLIENSPNLQRLYLDEMSTIIHGYILDLLSCGHCSRLQIIAMTREWVVNRLISLYSIERRYIKDLKNQDKLSALVLTQNRRHYPGLFFGGTSKIKGKEQGRALVEKVYKNLELLYLESCHPHTHVVWPEMFIYYCKDTKIEDIFKFRNLRFFTLHIQYTRRTTPNFTPEDLDEKKICRLLSHAPRLESFTYRMDANVSQEIKSKVGITDRLLQVLMDHCPKLTTFQVTGICHQFSSDQFCQFIETFASR